MTWTVTTKSNGQAAVAAVEPEPWVARAGRTVALELRPASASDYGTLRELLNHAGTVSTRTSVDGSVSFRQRIPSSAGIDSLLIEIVPDAGAHPQVTGLWGVVTGGDDASLSRGADLRLTLDLLVLAEAGAYADHTAAESAHEITV